MKEDGNRSTKEKSETAPFMSQTQRVRHPQVFPIPTCRPPAAVSTLPPGLNLTPTPYFSLCGGTGLMSITTVLIVPAEVLNDAGIVVFRLVFLASKKTSHPSLRFM